MENGENLSESLRLPPFARCFFNTLRLDGLEHFESLYDTVKLLT